jgi:hypothetical protein
MEEDLPARLDRTHTRLVAGPETFFAVVGLVDHVVTSIRGGMPQTQRRTFSEISTTHPTGLVGN